MNLDEFVKQVIISIITGVNESQTLLQDTNAIVNPSTIKGDYIDGHNRKVTEVKFDVAITTSKEGGSNKGVKINILDAFSGGLGDETKTANETISRVSFSVPVALPTVDNLQDEAKKEQNKALKNIVSLL